MKLLDQKVYIRLNNRKLFLHLIKANYFIVLSVKYFFLLINVISIISNFKSIFNIKRNLSVNIIKIISYLLKFYSNKLNELIFAIIYIQLKEFNEKTNILRVNDFNLNNDDIFDAIVIGSGPSGSITANNLKNKFKDVLILEKGNAFAHYSTKHPGDEFIYKWNNAGVNTTILKNLISFSSGSCYGGGSEINSGLLHYPDKKFVEYWKNDYNVKNLEFVDLKKNLDSLLNSNKLVSLQPESFQNISKNKFLNGILGSNLKYEKLLKFESYIKNNSIKNSMSNTILSNFKKNGGKVLLKYEVNKFYKKNNYWIIEGVKNNKRILFKCKYLFLCAGSIYTNQLLLKNNLFKKNNKPNFFKFHPMIKVIAEYPDIVQNGKENVHNLQITEYYPDFLIGQAASGYQFLKFAAYEKKNLSAHIDKYWKNMSIYHSTFSFGKGKILKSYINNQYIYSYEISDIHLGLIKKAIKIMIKSLYQSGAKKVYFIGKKIDLVKLNELEIFISNIRNINQLKFSSVHILGGIKMGEKKDCLVNSFGKINDYSNIYVNDSSLINHNLLKNPQGTIMSLAKRNVDNFLDHV